MPASQLAKSWKRAAPLFAALGDETRLKVVARLCEEGPLSIARLTEGGSVTRQAVTKHLQVLASAGLVRAARDGRESIYELQPRRLNDAQHWLALISKEWDDTVDRLRAFVEEDSF